MKKYFPQRMDTLYKKKIESRISHYNTYPKGNELTIFSNDGNPNNLVGIFRLLPRSPY
jgi:hypothetical protein